MAYARWGKDSDVYVYKTLGGYAFHLNKSFTKDESVNFIVKTKIEALYRLKRLITQGYMVPEYAIKSLEKEER